MIKHAESHLDHALTEAQVVYIMTKFVDRSAFFIETFELPEELGTVPCGLYGPIMGDAPVLASQVELLVRGTRTWKSRLVNLPARLTRQLTVIAGPHEEKCDRCDGTGTVLTLGFMVQFGVSQADAMGVCGRCENGVVKHACILFTAFGGPLAPQEPGEVRRQLEALEKLRGPLLCSDAPTARDEAAAIYAKIEGLRIKRTASDAFWTDHALVKEI